MAGHSVPIAGVADADAHTPVIGADMGADAPEPFVAGDSAAAFRTHLAGGEIDLVVQDDDGLGRKAVETHGGAHRAARIVHVSLRLESEHGLVADAALGDLAVEAGAPLESAEVMRRCQRIERHEAHVVAMPGRIGAGVAEADQQAGGERRPGRRGSGGRCPC